MDIFDRPEPKGSLSYRHMRGNLRRGLHLRNPFKDLQRFMFAGHRVARDMERRETSPCT